MELQRSLVFQLDPGVDLGPRVEVEPGGNEEFEKYRALVGTFDVAVSDDAARHRERASSLCSSLP